MKYIFSFEKAIEKLQGFDDDCTKEVKRIDLPFGKDIKDFLEKM